VSGVQINISTQRSWGVDSNVAVSGFEHKIVGAENGAARGDVGDDVTVPGRCAHGATG
jgi:hypothetical protein